MNGSKPKWIKTGDFTPDGKPLWRISLKAYLEEKEPTEHKEPEPRELDLNDYNIWNEDD